ncbi:variant erythrocyte surface antigen-1 family protein [Babesia caballi]|uniref:Variant erythrocyte surface antigen-1 family protein n=1 Tax=Babesia caballi TaxID=5871 RepID=A0AAV4LQZ1_BABCB|nr:variant erythrocyte surface antigen-1 family protein [Babesia caballi]
MAAKSLTDCPSNLKEAIDWILRVTSKDGGSGPGGTQQLAQAITKLEGFNEAIKASAGKLKDNKSGDATKALRELNNPTTLGPIIGQLSDGLKAFIGYGSGGKGIALVIDPLQQLRKGVLSFLLMMLDKLRGSIDAYTDVSDTLNKAIKGGDVVTFESAMQEVSKLQENSATGSQVKGVVSALKNIGSLRGKNDLNKLSQGFKEYLKAVLGAVENTVKEKAPQASPHVSTLCFQLQTLLEEVGKQSNDIHSQINAVEAAKTTLYANKGSGHPASTLIPAVTYGTANLLTQLKKDGYKSSYQPTLNWNGKDNKDRVSQIFLGCLPLYYYWLTCIGSVVRTGESGRGSALIAAPSKLSCTQKGSEVATLLQSLGMSSAIAPKPSHPELLGALDQSLQKVISSLGSTIAQSHSLSALFYVCRYYFTGRQIMDSNNPTIKPTPLTSIREMLYWLSGLQFSPNYSDLEKQIEGLIPSGGLQVADSGTSSPNNFISRDHMKGFLLSSCLSAPGVLGAIQGDSADTENEPWLYSLFCNSAFQFKYPSGSALFNALSRYSYAL